MCRDGFRGKCPQCGETVTCRDDVSWMCGSCEDGFIVSDDEAGEVRVHVGEPDWISDQALTPAERLARFESLHPRPTRGPLFSVAPPTSTTGTGTTVTYTFVH